MISKGKKEKIRLLYVMGIKKRVLCEVYNIKKSNIYCLLEGIPENKRVCFHLQEVDLNKIYEQYVKQ